MEQKIEQQELESLQTISKKYEELTIAFGQNKIQKILLQQQLEKLSDEEFKLQSEYSKNQTAERELITELNKKYGEGQLNLQSGVFIPNKINE